MRKKTGKRLYLFDFDETLNFLSTDKNPKATSRTVYEAKLWKKEGEARREAIRTNMKPGVYELFQKIYENENSEAGILTFSNAQQDVHAHFSAVGLSEEEIQKIHFEFRPDNFDPETSTKRDMALRIINKIGRENITEVVYADDTKRHVADILALMNELGIPCRTFVVPRAQMGNEKEQCAFIEELHNELITLNNPNKTVRAFHAMLGKDPDEKEICKLINKGNANSLDSMGLFSLMHYAVKANLLLVIQHLINCDAKMNFVGDTGGTALHEATKLGSLEAVEVLIRNGAVLNVRDKAGDSALDVAAENGHLGIIRALLAAGVDPSEPNHLTDKTADEVAFQSGHVNIARFILLSKGPIPEAEKNTLFGKIKTAGILFFSPEEKKNEENPRKNNEISIGNNQQKF